MNLYIFYTKFGLQLSFFINGNLKKKKSNNSKIKVCSKRS